MPVKISLFPVKDFTGGLHLRAAPLQLGENESADMLNVDVDPRGGIRMRKCCTPMNATTIGSSATAATSLWDFSNSSGTKHVMVSRGASMFYSTGSNFTAVTLAAHVGTGRHRATTFKDNCYIQNGTDKVAKWTGTAATEMTDPAVTGWAEDFAVPGSGKMVIGSLVTSHMGMVFAANTVENGSLFPNRVRFSHPNQPEAWRSIDFIDVDTGLDGDVITGIAPFGGRLLVFKNNSVYAIHGYSPETFQVVEISREVGATSQEAVAVSSQAVYFFSWPGGVYALGGQGPPTWLWERLHPVIEEGKIVGGLQSNFTLRWLNERLWVSVTATGSTNNVQYVYDPTLQKQGGWVKYDFPLGPMIEWTPPGSVSTFLGVGLAAAAGRILKLEIDANNDTYDGTAAVAVPSFYTTRWYDVGVPAIKKRWKGPELIFNAEYTAALRVDCYRDYDPSQIVRTFTADVVAHVTAGVWGTGVWGTLTWGSDDASKEQIVKGSLLGTARAVRIKLSGPTPSARWSLDALTLKYIPLRVKA